MLATVQIPDEFSRLLPQKKVISLAELIQVYDILDAKELEEAVQSDSGEYVSWETIKSKI